MGNIVQEYEKRLIENLTKDKEFPDFKPGDTLNVVIAIPNGKQAFKGICISRENKGASSSFVVRKISHGVAVEKKLPLYSPKVLSIERLKKGKVRRAKLYYLRDLSGKAARIKEDKSDK